MREQVVAALEESLSTAPEPAEVLAGMRAGIERRRRRARIGAVLGLVTLALVTTTVAAELSRHRDVPAAPAQLIPVGAWRSTIRAGWVPDGMTIHAISSKVTDEALYYTSDVASLSISLDRVDVGRDLDLPGWQRVSINRRQGREAAAATQALVVFPLPSGRWAQVRYARLSTNNWLTEAEYRAGAERVATSVRDDATIQLRVGFAATYLPRHQRIVGILSPARATAGFGSISVASGSLQPGTARDYNTDGIVDRRRPAEFGPGVTIAVNAMNFDPQVVVRIANIQGRPAYLADAGRSVFVADFHGGTLRVEATLDGEPTPSAGFPPPEAVPAPELIKVAEGVRWIG
jgi:hypothetical protein